MPAFSHPSSFTSPMLTRVAVQTFSQSVMYAFNSLQALMLCSTAAKRHRRGTRCSASDTCDVHSHDLATNTSAVTTPGARVPPHEDGNG